MAASELEMYLQMIGLSADMLLPSSGDTAITTTTDNAPCNITAAENCSVTTNIDFNTDSESSERTLQTENNATPSVDVTPQIHIAPQMDTRNNMFSNVTSNNHYSKRISCDNSINDINQLSQNDSVCAQILYTDSSFNSANEVHSNVHKANYSEQFQDFGTLQHIYDTIEMSNADKEEHRSSVAQNSIILQWANHYLSEQTVCDRITLSDALLTDLDISTLAGNRPTDEFTVDCNSNQDSPVHMTSNNSINKHSSVNTNILNTGDDNETVINIGDFNALESTVLHTNDLNSTFDANKVVKDYADENPGISVHVLPITNTNVTNSLFPEESLCNSANSIASTTESDCEIQGTSKEYILPKECQITKSSPPSIIKNTEQKAKTFPKHKSVSFSVDTVNYSDDSLYTNNTDAHEPNSHENETDCHNSELKYPECTQVNMEENDTDSSMDGLQDVPTVRMFHLPFQSGTWDLEDVEELDENDIEDEQSLSSHSDEEEWMENDFDGQTTVQYQHRNLYSTSGSTFGRTTIMVTSETFQANKLKQKEETFTFKKKIEKPEKVQPERLNGKLNGKSDKEGDSNSSTNENNGLYTHGKFSTRHYVHHMGPWKKTYGPHTLVTVDFNKGIMNIGINPGESRTSDIDNEDSNTNDNNKILSAITSKIKDINHNNEQNKTSHDERNSSSNQTLNDKLVFNARTVKQQNELTNQSKSPSQNKLKPSNQEGTSVSINGLSNQHRPMNGLSNQHRPMNGLANPHRIMLHEKNEITVQPNTLSDRTAHRKRVIAPYKLVLLFLMPSLLICAGIGLAVYFGIFHH